MKEEYAFVPQKDITAYELAILLMLDKTRILPDLLQEVAEKIPDIRRHFKLID